jgi:hypothetical protein
MAFSEQMSSFFDELSAIVDQQRRIKADGMDRLNDRPYSSMLTQDEEPVQQLPEAPYEPDPSVVIRTGGA